jgi:hypothetical protein
MSIALSISSGDSCAVVRKKTSPPVSEASIYAELSFDVPEEIKPTQPFDATTNVTLVSVHPPTPGGSN